MKSATGIGKLFPPPVPMVGGVKRWQGFELLTPQAYTERYYALVRARYKADCRHFLELLRDDEIVLLCYCRADTFCHRYLAADILEKIAAAHDIAIVRGGELPIRPL